MTESDFVLKSLIQISNKMDNLCIEIIEQVALTHKLNFFILSGKERHFKLLSSPCCYKTIGPAVPGKYHDHTVLLCSHAFWPQA